MTDTRTLPTRALMALAAIAVAVSALAVPSPASAADKIRFGGANRYETAAILSQYLLGDCRIAVANGENFPDGLAGAVLEVPILLTKRDALPDETVAELDRLESTCDISVIYVLGGTAAVSAGVFDQLAAYTTPAFTVRIAGGDRYETALAVARYHADFGPPEDPNPSVFLTTGKDFPDALAAGPVAGQRDYPIILNDGDALRPDVVDFLMDYGIPRVFILGGTAAVPASVEAQLETELGLTVFRLAGEDRAATAREIAMMFSHGADCALLVNGHKFPDALAAGPVGAKFECPILLVNRNSLPSPTHQQLQGGILPGADIAAIGGTATISEATLDAAVDAATP